MGRKKENQIYSMFEYNEETKKSKCLMEGCNHYLKGNHGYNLLRHFFSQHKAKYDEIQKQNMANKENTRMPDQPSRNAKSVMECCTRLVTIHGRPFNIVEDEAFKELLKMIPVFNQKEQRAINVKNIKENISAMAYELRLQISKELKDYLLALKVDVASIKLRRFLGLNIQYISNGKIVLRNLSVVELHDRNTAEYLKENIAMVLSCFGIELHQILTITTDSGANMLRMVNIMDDSIGEVPSDESDESFYELQTCYFSPNSSDGLVDEMDIEEEDFEMQIEEEQDNIVVRKISSVRCAAHCLQLAVRDACHTLQDFLDQCRQIIRSLRTPNMSLKLKQQNLPQATIDMPVRWDSTMTMLECLKKLKLFCIANLDVSAEIWPSLDKYLKILQPCKYLSKALQKEQITFGDFYISWMRCRHQVAQIDDPFARHLESCMINRQASLFENEHFLAALYLDPRVNSVLTTEQTANARILLTDVYKRIVRLLQQNKTRPQESQGLLDSATQPGTSRQELSNLTNFDDYLRQQFVSNTNRQEISNAHSLEREISFKLVEFLQEPVLPSDHNILDYWEKKRITDPYLYNLAKVVLATPPTSVSVERLFSSLKFVLNNLRMRLNDKIIEDVMIVRNNHLYSK